MLDGRFADEHVTREVGEDTCDNGLADLGLQIRDHIDRGKGGVLSGAVVREAWSIHARDTCRARDTAASLDEIAKLGFQAGIVPGGELASLIHGMFLPL